jgi:hypothetical protein
MEQNNCAGSVRPSGTYPQGYPLLQWSDRRRLRQAVEGRRSLAHFRLRGIGLFPRPAAPLAALLLRAQHPVEGRDNLGKSPCDTFVAPLTLAACSKKYRIGACTGEL